jgi:hypothetical protein
MIRALSLLLGLICIGFAGLFAYNGLADFARAALVEAFCVVVMGQVLRYPK